MLPIHKILSCEECRNAIAKLELLNKNDKNNQFAFMASA